MEELKAIRIKIKNTFEYVTNKKKIVYDCYIKYIEKNKKNHFFGLDSFHFQNKLIELEYDNMSKLYNFIDNRIYCDYYKLFGLIIQFFKKNFKQDKYETLIKNNSYPTYKDLEPYKVYDFDVVNDIHSDLIILINHLYKSVKKTNEEINIDKEKMKNGLNIENYIHNYIYTNTLLESNIQLFENYLSSYHKCHSLFLSNLKEKMILMTNHLDNIKEDKEVIVQDNEVIEPNIIVQVINEVIEPNANEVIVQDNEVIEPNIIVQVINEVIEPNANEVIVQDIEPIVEPIINEVIVQDIVQDIEPNSNEVIVQDIEPIVELIANEVIVQDIEPIIELIAQVIVQDIEPIVNEFVPDIEPIVEPIINEIVGPIAQVINSQDVNKLIENEQDVIKHNSNKKKKKNKGLS